MVKKRLKYDPFEFAGLGGDMHFIEQLFGFSPDAGTGLTELFLFLVPVVACLLAIYRWRSRTSAK